MAAAPDTCRPAHLKPQTASGHHDENAHRTQPHIVRTISTTLQKTMTAGFDPSGQQMQRKDTSYAHSCVPPMSAPTALTTAHPEAAALPCRKDDGYADSTPPGAQAST